MTTTDNERDFSELSSNWHYLCHNQWKKTSSEVNIRGKVPPNGPDVAIPHAIKFNAGSTTCVQNHSLYGGVSVYRQGLQYATRMHP